MINCPEPVMNFLKNITIRRMMLIILALFTVIWGITSIYTLNSFSSMNRLLDDTIDQKKNFSNLVKGNDQYFRSVTRMMRVVDYRQAGDADNAQKTLTSASTALKNSEEALAQFRRGGHIGVDGALANQMIDVWSRLLQNGMAPMLKAVNDGRNDDFQQLYRQQYMPLSVEFGDVANKYVNAVQSDETTTVLKTHIAINQNVLLAALVIGVIVLFLSDRYLVNYLVTPIGQIKRHLELLTSGKLGVELDEFGRNCAGQLIPYIRAMQHNLSNTVQTIHTSSSVIHTGTSEIRQGNDELSRRT
ncbi:methyl-accepting chemotaxis protein, partial [Dickeya dianthicola]|nr:methyl-accepting chemotaxis protein [Dickeya dianthicola]MBI0504870.1 methyl-accepting chemotaxis protein [Dickeya dianthicola]MBI0529596.1 methyl-accepting chemotaxis protein [Dickeya dianthicola]MBI0548472.1 methyl-accepting chemotaxis protein [Dickeya dianthicola]